MAHSSTPVDETSGRAVATWRPVVLALGLGLLLVVVGLAKYGIGTFPQWVVLWDIAAHLQDPRAGVFVQPHTDYLLGHWAAAAMAGLLGMGGTREQFGAFQIALTLTAIIWPFLMPSVRRAPELARAVFVLMAGGPVLAILLFWVGGYDPLTVIGASIVGLARSRWAMAAGWLLLGINHSTMAALALVAWVPILWLTRPDERPARKLQAVGMAVLAAMLGSVVTRSVIGLWGGGTQRRLMIPLSSYDARFFEQYVPALPWIALSVFGLGWILLVHLRIKQVRGAGTLLLLGVAFAILVPFRGLDATRDTALPLLPALLAFLLAAFATTPGNEVLRSRWWWGYSVGAVLLPTILVFGFVRLVLGWGS